MKNLILIWPIIFCVGFIFVIFLQVKPLHITSLIRWLRNGLRAARRHLRRIKYSPVASKYTFDHQIRRCAKIVLTEFIDAIVALKSNPFVMFLVGMSLNLSFLITQGNVLFGQELANTLSAIIVGLIAIFITVATFIATISRQSYDRRRDTEHSLNKELRKHTSVSKRMFIDVIANKIMQPYEERHIVEGYAAATVFDQDSYQEFKKTLKDNTQGKFTREYWPYSTTYRDIASSAVTYRPYAVKNLINQWETLESSTRQRARATSEEANKLKDACYEYENSGNANYYNQQGFLGAGLIRAVAYGLIATLVPIIYKYINNLTLDLTLRSIIEFLLLTYSFLAFLLCIRYLFRLLGYLRTSSPFSHNAYTVNNFYDTTANSEDNMITFK